MVVRDQISWCANSVFSPCLRDHSVIQNASDSFVQTRLIATMANIDLMNRCTANPLRPNIIASEEPATPPPTINTSHTSWCPPAQQAESAEIRIPFRKLSTSHAVSESC